MKKERIDQKKPNNAESTRREKKLKKSPPKEKSEARARAYTRNELNRLGWNVKHPSHKGQLLEEQEAKNFDERFKELLGLERPDFLIYNDNKPDIVIETKNEKEKINEAVQEAKDYAEKLSTKYFDVRIAIGVAGNEDDGVIVRNYYRKDDKKWYEIVGNGQCLSQILTLEQFTQVIKNKNPTTDVKIPTETEFYGAAEKINDIFYEADVSPEDRGIYLGGIILALKEGDIDIKPNIIIKQINANIESALDRYGKPKLKDILKIKSETEKLKNKLPLIFHQLDRLNIKSLMFADGDILGKFFETFLMYGNNISKLGVVFTPRHITKFMCDLVDVKSTDIIYDLTCGTGGFLVSAFHTMKSQVSNNSEALSKIKIEQLIGVDSENSGRIPALAVVNMIFRGDGRSNIYHENCFTFKFKGKDSKFATKVLMNPPHAKQTEPEIKFLEYGLKALQDGHLLGAIMPYSVFSQKTLKKWRQNLLKEHTLLASITMPSDLFYPISQNVVIILMKAHIPHSGKTWFCRIENDGYKIKRNKRVECEGEQLSRALSMYKAKDLNLGIQEKEGFACYRELDPNDDLVELVPEAYLDSLEVPKNIIQENINQMIREFGAFNLKYELKLKKIKSQIHINSLGDNNKIKNEQTQHGIKTISDIFDIKYGQHKLNSKEELGEGECIVVSSQGADNGCYGFYDVDVNYREPIISVPRTGSIGMVFVQEYPCCIDDNCLVLSLKDGIEISIEEMYFISAIIRLDSWRYRYGRQVTSKRLGKLVVDFSEFDYAKTKSIKENMNKIVNSQFVII